MSQKLSFLIISLILFHSACNLTQTKTYSKWIEPYTGMEFVQIPKGDFYMGNPYSSKDSSSIDKLHKVIISKDFWMSQTEVTLKQWKRVMRTEELHPEKPNPFRNDDPNYPVVSISYYDVQNFLEKL